MQRREFLKAVGSVPVYLVTSRLLAQGPASSGAAQSVSRAFRSRKPNIVIIMTDQQRTPSFLPREWVRAHLPSFERLRRHGLEFTNAFTNACQCTPSRATFLTSKYPAEHGVTTTFSAPGEPFVNLETPENPLGGPKSLPGNIPNLARVLQSAGYEVVYKGKWHESRPVNYPEKRSAYWSKKDIEHMAKTWGFQAWNPPDAGNSLSDWTTFGGGYAQNDWRFIHAKGDREAAATVPLRRAKTPGWGEGALEFLRKRKDDEGPFCLLINLVNPHDIVAFPEHAAKGGYDVRQIVERSELREFKAPKSYSESLVNKPRVQKILRNHWDDFHPLLAGRDQDSYVQFYVYLQELVDRLIMDVLDAIENTWLDEETLVIRLADHGEMGLAHGGLRGKEYNAYEETIRIPMIFSSKALWPEGESTDAFAGLLDILPTLAELVGASEEFETSYRGQNLSRILEHPGASVQDYIHFTYDDVFLAGLQVPGHIRTLRTKDSKYSVYFNPGYTPAGGNLEFELYDLSGDPLDPGQEVNNLAQAPLTPETKQKWKGLHDQLTRVMKQLGTTPGRISWPSAEEAIRLAQR